MPSVYNYRHVELDKVGRGKRVIQPPGGQTADIFGARSEVSYSSASSQAGSDVASSRVHIETDQQSIGGNSSVVMDGVMKPVVGQPLGGPNNPQQLGNGAASGGQISPSGSIDSSVSGRQQQQLLMADDFKPTTAAAPSSVQQPQQQKLIDLQQQAAADANRSPKKTIPVLRRNPITGEILDDPTTRQVVRVRQPPGGRSSGIF